tara:strand:- start:633 stop:1394 length:762 start_codon:yes stop_codon:yes gene_type:complete
LKLPKDYFLSDLLSHNVRGDISLTYGFGDNVWMHPPVHRILGWSSKPSNLNLKRNVWKLNQVKQIVNNEIFIKGEPAISDLATLNRFPNLLYANLINNNGAKIGVVADFLFHFRTGKIQYYLISRSNPKIPGSSRWKLNIDNIVDQQPGLVFSSVQSLDQLNLMKSSFKNEFLKKGKKIFNRFDDMKNIAANRIEDWLEEDDDANSNYSSFNKNIFQDDAILKNRREQDNIFNSDNINSKSSSNKYKEDDPWI